MFSTLGMMNLLKSEYSINFEEILTDNGAEFGSGRWAKNKETNPFEYYNKFNLSCYKKQTNQRKYV